MVYDFFDRWCQLLAEMLTGEVEVDVEDKELDDGDTEFVIVSVLV